MAETSLVARFVMDVAAAYPDSHAHPDTPMAQEIAALAQHTRDFLKAAAHWESAMAETARLTRGGASADAMDFARGQERRAYTQTQTLHRTLAGEIGGMRKRFGETPLAEDARWSLLEMVSSCFATELDEHRARYFATGPLGAIE